MSNSLIRTLVGWWFGLISVSVVCGGQIGSVNDIPELPRLRQSDWIDVTKDVQPKAVADGFSDCSDALQAALDRCSAGGTVFLPRGVYCITKTLIVHGPRTGMAIIGEGLNTRLVWHGDEDGRMLWSDGAAYSRYVGLYWDGCERAAVGFDHAASRRFETEILHESEEFTNFRGYGIRVGEKQKFASAEICVQKCFFRRCKAALGFLSFNDYNNTIDRCEFRDCNIGVFVGHANFYARNSHFERSAIADFEITGEHGCSIRRCSSKDSFCFLRQPGSTAPLILQDCDVSNWKDSGGAVFINAGEALIFDCRFQDAHSPRVVPVKAVDGRQKIVSSNNHPSEIADLISGVWVKGRSSSPSRQRGQVYEIPTEIRSRSLRKRLEGPNSVLSAIPAKVFDVIRDFGARGDGVTDDSDAIQKAIDAARLWGHGAMTYGPARRAAGSHTLLLVGKDYRVRGSGFGSGLVWRGREGDALVIISNVENVVLGSLMVGHHDLGPMSHGDDILVTSAGGGVCGLMLDEIYAFGMYQKAQDKHGIHFNNLPAGSWIDADHLQGNIRITDCGQAKLMFRSSYEGTVTIDGRISSPEGLIGFQTRVATVCRPALIVRNSQTVVMSDYFNEQSDQIALLEGKSGQSPGRVTIQSPKIHMNTRKPIFDIENYAGTIYLGQSQFYCSPEASEFMFAGENQVQLLCVGNSWYRCQPGASMLSGLHVGYLGNTGAEDSPMTKLDLKSIALALSDLRDLGDLDRWISDAKD